MYYGNRDESIRFEHRVRTLFYYRDDQSIVIRYTIGSSGSNISQLSLFEELKLSNFAPTGQHTGKHGKINFAQWFCTSYVFFSLAHEPEPTSVDTRVTLENVP